MSKKFSKEPIRGMDDYYPSDLREVNWIIETIRDITERYGYEEYATPQIEPVEIFAAKSSDELVNEQSLILEGSKGWYVLTGCSHPGLEKILNIAKQIGNIVGIIGGFHGFNNFQLVEKLDLICPCHCTAHKEDLKKAFPDKFSKCGVGKIINLGVKT